MKTIKFQHSIIEKEVSFLKKLIGRDLCGIGSNSISIEPSNSGLWVFHEWIELSNWNDNGIIRLNYSYDETYSLDDFIKLRIESHNRERRALNAEINFTGNDKFTIAKIETYGYDSEYNTKNLSGEIQKANLKKNELYDEKMSIENAILLYSMNGKRIWVECLYSNLEVIVTIDEDYIEKKLNHNETEFNAQMKLKREIK